MSESSGVQPILDAATRAAASSDWPTAEKCLRLALRMQEVALGPSHPELASILNNLAVVCEVSQKLDEAEMCYRRALTIVTSSLPPGHASVVTARQNLREFCEAHNLALDVVEELPAPADDTDAVVLIPPPAGSASSAATAPPWSRAAAVPALAAPDELPAAVEPPIRLVPPKPPIEQPAPPRPAAVPAARPPTPHWRSPLAIVAVAGVLILGIVGALRSGDDADGSASSTNTPAAPPKTAAAAPVKRERPAAKRPAGATTSPAPAPTVVDARLCAALSTGAGEWTCTPPGNPIGAGQLTFYTRIKSPTDTAVEHRWYRNGELRQSGALQIRANLGAGYRTFSRHTIDAAGAGDWRVELRAPDGTLLHEERFVIR
jgi:hypothetical protein